MSGEIANGCKHREKFGECDCRRCTFDAVREEIDRLFEDRVDLCAPDTGGASADELRRDAVQRVYRRIW